MQNTHEEYPRGPDLSPYFTPPSKQSTEAPLPPMFHDRCNNRWCTQPMERMPVLVWTRRKPYAIFQCPRCYNRLYLFKEERSWHFIWSEDVSGQPDFSKAVEDALQKSAEDRIRKEVRETGTFTPP